MSLRILGVTFDSKMTFEILLRKVVSQAVRNLRVVLRAGKLFDICLRAVLMHMFCLAWSTVPREDIVGVVSFGFA